MLKRKSLIPKDRIFHYQDLFCCNFFILVFLLLKFTPSGQDPWKAGFNSLCSLQGPAATSVHLVTMATPGRLADRASPASATTTSTCWTRSRATPELGSVCAACITARALPARAANWVTMATPCCKTAGVSALVYYNQ